MSLLRRQPRAISRRRFLQAFPGLLGVGTGVLHGQLPFLGTSRGGSPNRSSATHPLFVPVPPEHSGITWKHVNGRSPNYYLPETTGAGCAFFDYDNDGWMDVYLVNSGRCDFYDPRPALRNALSKNDSLHGGGTVSSHSRM